MTPFKLETMAPPEIKALVQASQICRMTFKGDARKSMGFPQGKAWG